MKVGVKKHLRRKVVCGVMYEDWGEETSTKEGGLWSYV